MLPPENENPENPHARSGKRKFSSSVDDPSTSSQLVINADQILSRDALCQRSYEWILQNKSVYEVQIQEEIGVRFTPNDSLECSMRQRIAKLENEKSPFLLDRGKGEYWQEVSNELSNSSSQREYNILLHCSNLDLQIKEKKQSCFIHFQQILGKEPSLSANAGYNPEDMFFDFLEEKRTALEKIGVDVDRQEMLLLANLESDLQRHGPHSQYMGEILDSSWED